MPEKNIDSKRVKALLGTTYTLIAYGIQKTDRDYVAVYRVKHKNDVFYLCFHSHDRDEKVTSVEPSFKGRDWTVNYYDKLSFDQSPRYQYGIYLQACYNKNTAKPYSVFLSESSDEQTTLFPEIDRCAVDAMYYNEKGIKYSNIDQITNILQYLSFCDDHYTELVEKGLDEYACVVDNKYKSILDYFEEELGFEEIYEEPNLKTPEVCFDHTEILANVKRDWTDWDAKYRAIADKVTLDDLEMFFDRAIRQTISDVNIVIRRAISHFYSVRKKYEEAFGLCEKYCSIWWDDFVKRSEPGEHELRFSCIPKYVTILLEQERYKDAIKICDMAGQYGFDVGRLRTKVLKKKCLLNNWSFEDSGIFLLTKKGGTFHRNDCSIVRKIRTPNNLLAIRDIEGAQLWGKPCKMCCGKIKPQTKTAVKGTITVNRRRSSTTKFELCYKYSIKFNISSEKYAQLFNASIKKLFPQKANEVRTIERDKKLIRSYDLVFDKIDDKFKTLLAIALRHGKAKMTVDGKLIDSREFGFAQSCQYRTAMTCHGVCRLLGMTNKIGAFSLTDLDKKYRHENRDMVEINDYEYYSLAFKDVLNHTKENLFTLDKAKVIKNVARQLCVKEMCDNINVARVYNYIDKLPNKVRVSFLSPADLKAVIGKQKGIEAVKEYRETHLEDLPEGSEVFELEWKLKVYKKQKWVRYNKIFLSRYTNRILLVRNKIDVLLIDCGQTIMWEKRLDSAIMAGYFTHDGGVKIATRKFLVSYDDHGQELDRKTTSTGRHDNERGDQVLLGPKYIAFYYYPNLFLFDHDLNEKWLYPPDGPSTSLGEILALRGAGRIAVTTSEEGQATVYDRRGREDGHSGSIMCGSMNAKDLVAVGTNCGELCVYNVQGDLEYFVGYCEATDEFVYSPSAFWQRGDRHGTAAIRSVAMSDVDSLAANVSGSLVLLSTAKNVLWKFNFAKETYGKVFISSDGKYCGCTADNVCLLFHQDGTLAQQLQCESSIGDVVIDSERKRLFLYDNNLNCFSIERD